VLIWIVLDILVGLRELRHELRSPLKAVVSWPGCVTVRLKLVILTRIVKILKHWRWDKLRCYTALRLHLIFKFDFISFRFRPDYINTASLIQERLSSLLENRRRTLWFRGRPTPWSLPLRSIFDIAIPISVILLLSLWLLLLLLSLKIILSGLDLLLELHPQVWHSVQDIM